MSLPDIASFMLHKEGKIPVFELSSFLPSTVYPLVTAARQYAIGVFWKMCLTDCNGAATGSADLAVPQGSPNSMKVA